MEKASRATDRKNSRSRCSLSQTQVVLTGSPFSGVHDLHEKVCFGSCVFPFTKTKEFLEILKTTKPLAGLPRVLISIGSQVLPNSQFPKATNSFINPLCVASLRKENEYHKGLQKESPQEPRFLLVVVFYRSPPILLEVLLEGRGEGPPFTNQDPTLLYLVVVDVRSSPPESLARSAKRDTNLSRPGTRNRDNNLSREELDMV